MDNTILNADTGCCNTRTVSQLGRLRRGGGHIEEPERVQLKGGVACRGAALSLSRLQDALGDDTFGKLLSGSDTPLLCALKSIPTYSMEASELPNSAQVQCPANCLRILCATYRAGAKY